MKTMAKYIINFLKLLEDSFIRQSFRYIFSKIKKIKGKQLNITYLFLLTKVL